MLKNYKRRGYPGKELKKQKKDREERDIYQQAYEACAPPLMGALKHEEDCENQILRNHISFLKSEVASLKWEMQDKNETWNKNKKEHATLNRKISRLKHHLDTLTNKKETILRHTVMSRLIKNIGC